MSEFHFEVMPKGFGQMVMQSYIPNISYLQVKKEKEKSAKCSIRVWSLYIYLYIYIYTVCIYCKTSQFDVAQ